MPSSPVNEIIRGYIEEVRTYIPSLTGGLETLKKSPGQHDVLEELHRLVHTIKGASLMVGIPGLSHIALQMETFLSDILGKKMNLTPAAIQVMARTVDRFGAYCDGLTGPGVRPRDMLRSTVLEYRRLRGLPETEDGDALQSVITGIPETEGGSDLATAGEMTEEVPEVPDEEMQSPSPAETASRVTMIPPEMPDILPELLESFYEEAKEHLEDLDGLFNALETRITAPGNISPEVKEILRRIRRAVHTLKGAAAVIGLSNVSAWGHTMEDFLDWLYEEAQKISPDTVALLMESGDLLTRIISSPADPQSTRSGELKKRYEEIMGETAPPAPEPAVCPPLSGERALSAPLPDPDIFARHSQTLRVGTERVDDLVNLAGELIIVASAFDQQVSAFTDSLNELDMARNRIRDVARNMEVNYEVKALEGLRGDGIAPAPPPEAPAEESEFEDFDTLELDRYSELSLIIRTLNESAIDVGAIYSRLTNLHSDVEGHFNRQRVLLSELQDKMMQVRMLPMSTLSNRLRRTVREVSKRLGKKIRLTIVGEEIELDRMIWDKLTDPLMHLLRNAADHGIEPPETRREKGKPPMATLTLSASREGNQVVIRVSDDGAGLDYKTIRRKAMKAGFLDKSTKTSEKELAPLIFKPGFSTRDTISEVSGRGVGMDVVRENIHELKGTVRVASRPDRGTQFTIRIPLTLAAVRALLFTVGERPFAVALTEVREILRIEPENRIPHPRRAIRVGNEILRVRSLKQILGMGRDGDGASAIPLHAIVLVLETDGNREAFEIDGLIGQREIVIKSTGTHLRYVRGISGVTIIGDGSVVPILNIPELTGDADRLSAGAEDHFETPEAAISPERPLSIMIVDDSVSIRQVVSRLIEEQGWEALTAKDGIDALEKLRDSTPGLILLDIEMPRMNGYEFLSAMRSDPEYRDIPVIMLTSRATAKHREKALSLGASGFMVKPYNENEFINLILTLTE
ncbi:hypothetical protein DENIS_0078 [Desulfonema ishimotonii]|uniref:histidine kinase n=1 Tax=Desulfonema ishimotonii TaxID=45657 RepID=A0A401FQE4_9BACT|nr:hybrid sensor histidine kinase/response regulator [Desulfonema ishimotonii]GBC59142.1 hypothetical protein DENIS_0078 [Desulfonema ishimotonii]